MNEARVAGDRQSPGGRASVLLLAEQRQGRPAAANAHGLTLARALGEVTLLVTGEGAEAAAGELARLAGVAAVLAAPGVEETALLVRGWAERFSHILAPATAWGREVMPRLAGMLERPLLSEVVARVDDRTFRRPVHAGSLLATVAVSASPVLLTVRPSAFPPTPLGDAPCPVTRLADAVPWPGRRTVAFLPSPGERPELATARVVVAGGRGFQSVEDFQWVARLADRLGGAVGATRSAVDAGLAPNDWQVGQTGKVVVPELYLAVALSGALQHLAGIRDARTIAAINHDPHAPILAVADVAWVASWQQALPELLAALGGEAP